MQEQEVNKIEDLFEEIGPPPEYTTPNLVDCIRWNKLMEARANEVARNFVESAGNLPDLQTGKDFLADLAAFRDFYRDALSTLLRSV